MTHTHDAYDELRRRARGAGEPLRIRDLVAVWAATNNDQLISVAFRAMREPVGTQFVIPPLSLVAFATPEGRDEYYATLYEEVRRTQKGTPTAQRVGILHVQRFIAWCRMELEERFAEIVRLEMAYHKDTLEAEPVTTQE